MSLSRLALRLAAIEALNPAAAAGSGPWPTLAGAEVYEERLDLLAHSETQEDLDIALAAIANKPVIIVYTEESNVAPYGALKYPPREEMVTLVVELSIGAQGVVTFVNAAGETISVGTAEAPVTDRQQAALLDVLEAQVSYIFDGRNQVASAALLRKVAMETHLIHSDPQRAADRTLRLALRTVKFHIKVKTTCWPAPGATLGEGLAALPYPLRDVALGLSLGSSGATLCAALAAAMPGPTPLGSAPFTLNLGIGPAVTPAPGQTVAEVVAANAQETMVFTNVPS
jgi:hypothetical protein